MMHFQFSRTTRVLEKGAHAILGAHEDNGVPVVAAHPNSIFADIA